MQIIVFIIITRFNVKDEYEINVEENINKLSYEASLLCRCRF